MEVVYGFTDPAIACHTETMFYRATVCSFYNHFTLTELLYPIHFEKNIIFRVLIPGDIVWLKKRERQRKRPKTGKQALLTNSFSALNLIK